MTFSRTLASSLFVAAGIALGATSIAPANAMPVSLNGTQIETSGEAGIIQVRGGRHNGGRHHGDRHHGGWGHNGGHGHHYGHRRWRHRGYDRWDSGDFFAGAATGALMGAVINGAANANSYDSGSHVTWCANKYRSYNRSTNTYTGYDGRSHRCNSPYN